MKASRITLIAASVCGLGLSAACSKGDNTVQQIAATSARPTSRYQLDSTAIRRAEGALRQFLDASRDGSPTRDSLPMLTACDDDGGGSWFPTTLLAGYSLLPFDVHGDTVVARASVVTVAEQDVDRRASRFNARQRVREDVLEWDVVPSENSSGWVVCNGLRFGYLGADSLTTWSPAGASYVTARALVDSIVSARGN